MMKLLIIVVLLVISYSSSWCS
ncbi:type I toxin-antitoxin system Ibs family toxin [Escherichia coli]|nr:type I toxin-antitoxin system Ibs family toxin [Escherichia coli]